MFDEAPMVQPVELDGIRIGVDGRECTRITVDQTGPMAPLAALELAHRLAAVASLAIAWGLFPGG